MTRFFGFFIVCPVAIITVAGDTGEFTVKMTKFAGSNSMRPHERKIGLIMIECRRRPGLKVVTFQAIVAELSRNMIRFGD